MVPPLTKLVSVITMLLHTVAVLLVCSKLIAVKKCRRRSRLKGVRGSWCIGPLLKAITSMKPLGPTRFVVIPRFLRIVRTSVFLTELSALTMRVTQIA